MLATLDPLRSEPDECPLPDTLLLVLEDRPDDCSDDAKLRGDPESDCDDRSLLPADGLCDEARDDLLSDADDCPELGTLDLLPEEIADDRESDEPLRDDADDCEPEDLLTDDLLAWLLEDILGRLSDDREDLASDERDESDVMLSPLDDRLRREDDVLLPDSSLDDGLLLLDPRLLLEREDDRRDEGELDGDGERDDSLTLENDLLDP